MSGTSAGMRRLVSGLSVLVLAGSVIALARLVPVEPAVERLRGWVEDRGVVGAVTFGAAYVVAGLAFVPGLALTVAAGAVFGVVKGTIVVSLASTTTAAFAFLIARHLARARVEGWARGSPRFAAIDRAIGAQGWRIVALLRLSPAVPFSLGNYLYGLTAVRFWPYVLASWTCMLPATVVYVFLGDAGARGLEAASGAPVGGGRLALWIAGLAATVFATVLITRAARRALARQAELEPGRVAGPKEAPGEWGGGRVGRVALPASALLLLGATVLAYARRDAVQRLFGPPRVTMREAHANARGGATFDHRAFDAVLRARVDAEGRVDYDALAADPAPLDAYLAALAAAPVAELGRDERLALLINAYNAFTLRLILDHLPLTSIRDIPAAERWEAARWTLGGRTYSLDQLEHQEIRRDFVEPRVHFALVCAARGCPPLRAEAYTGVRLDRQLEEQATYVHAHARWFRFDAEAGLLRVTRLYAWYADDFRQVAGSVIAFAARYSPALKQALDAGTAPEPEYLDYDWRLNGRERTP